MNLAQSVAVYLPGIISGILLVAVLWHEERPTATILIIGISLGAGIGVGLTSVLYFFYMLLFAGMHFFIYLQLVLLVFAFWVVLRHRRISFHFALLSPKLQGWQIVLAASIVVILTLSMLSLSHIWTHDAYGGWDAFMIYNRTARFIYRDQVNWVQAFSPEIWPGFHADYPLLIPLSVANGWDVLGRESQTMPRLLSGIFTLACVSILASGIARFRSIWQAVVGLAILLNTQALIREAVSQTADLPLAFYMLCSVLLIFIYASRQEPGVLTLAGVTTGLAGWTKNEGELFALAVTASLSIIMIRQGQGRQIGSFLIGLALPAAAVLWFKLFMAPPNDLVGTSAFLIIQRIFEWPRHVAILNSLYSALMGGGIFPSMTTLMIVYALVFGFAPQKHLAFAYATAMLSMGIQAAGYYCIYLITPHAIQWQLDSSMSRLLLHIFLPLLFVFFVLVADIGKALEVKGKMLSAESAT